MPPTGVAPSVPDAESSPAPTVDEGKIPAEALEAGVAVAVQEGAMEVGAATAVEEPDEVEPEEAADAEPQEDEEAEEPQEDTSTGMEPDDEAEDDPDEDPKEEEEGEANAREKTEAVAEEDSDEENVMPLAVLMPGEVQEDNEFEETEDEEEEGESQETEDEEEDEPSEVDEESEEAEAEELVEAGKAAEESGVVNDGTKGLVDRSAADDMNDISQGERVRCGNSKDKIADQLSNGSDAGGNRSGDVQNSELAGALEIMVDELPKDCVEEDIKVVFSECGEIKSVRIIKNSSSEKSKDIAFICYASIEAANKALTEFKEGIEVKGIKVRVSACQDNNALYLGNICKSWTEDQVLATLKNIGIQECKISLPLSKGRKRGFAFLKFKSHYFARAAFRRLMKPDAIFGTEGSVRVSFYQKPTKPSDDLMEAKRVYLEHVPLSWDEDKVKECCEGYGKILKIDLFQISKNMKNETFSFVEFLSSKSALACVKGINDANIVNGGFKLSACLARPKIGATEGAASSKKEDEQAKKVCVDKNSVEKLPTGNKSRLTSRTKEVVVKKNAPSNLRHDDRKLTSEEAAEELKTSKPSEGERKLGKNRNSSANQRPLKKARNNRNVDGSNLTYQSAAVLQTSNPSAGKRKPVRNRNTYMNERPLKKAHNNGTVRQPNRSRGTGQPAGPQYASNSRAHHSLGGSSRSKAYAADLEPHAGYIPPANQVHNINAYDQRRTAHYNIHPLDVHPYARETAPSRSTYSDYTSRARYQTGYEYVYPPPSTSESYYPGRVPFITRRGDY